MADEKRNQDGQSARTSKETVAAPALAASVPKEAEEYHPIKTDFGFLPIPKRLRYNPKRPAHFGLLLNATFGIASTFGRFVAFTAELHTLTILEQLLRTCTTANRFSSNTQDRLA